MSATENATVIQTAGLNAFFYDAVHEVAEQRHLHRLFDVGPRHRRRDPLHPTRVRRRGHRGYWAGILAKVPCFPRVVPHDGGRGAERRATMKRGWMIPAVLALMILPPGPMISRILSTGTLIWWIFGAYGEISSRALSIVASMMSRMCIRALFA